MVGGGKDIMSYILNKSNLNTAVLTLWGTVDPVYVGRPTRWGNPFTIGKDGDRKECCRKFNEWAWADEQAEWREAVRTELAGKDLLCWCAPKQCHAETLRTICERR